MRVVYLPRAFYHIARHLPVELSPAARQRLNWLNSWQALREKGFSTTEASNTLALPRSSLYRWRKRLKRQGLQGLEDKSRRPRRRRSPTWSPELARAVLGLREQYPRWGKDKLVVLLRRDGWHVSTSMVGRILQRLKERGVLREPPRNGVATSRHHHPRPYAIRKPRDYGVEKPGDLVQGGYPRPPPPARGGLQALHRPGCGQHAQRAPGCGGGPPPGYRSGGP